MSERSIRIAVVEDDEALRDAIARALRGDGFLVSAFADADRPDQVLEFGPDLIMLDIGLGRIDGFTLARWLHDRRDVPIVFVTARDSVADRLAGFGLGADDYVLKPFALEELLARVRAVLRRTGRLQPPRLELADLLVDEAGGTASRSGQTLGLTATEFRLLVFLMRNRGRVLSKVQLLSQVWGYEAYDPNLVEVHVHSLRRKLEQYGPRVIHTVRGLGYRLSAP